MQVQVDGLAELFETDGHLWGKVHKMAVQRLTQDLQNPLHLAHIHEYLRLLDWRGMLEVLEARARVEKSMLFSLTVRIIEHLLHLTHAATVTLKMTGPQ